ncbi:MAG: LysR family transcriptional regulator [Myxococcales bacterium FL481]|nr:MAG: LysR family transcriptional regulator [Myxococcales bacterium FL481]
MKVHEMELLVRVAETNSMTLAAHQLHLTPAAVSATVQRVENAIGVRLFERTTRSLHLTDEGRVVIDGCKDVVEMWQRTLDDARGHRTELEGTVHLSAPADTTYELLESVTAELSATHPSLRLVVHAGDAVAHLHREAIDMAIRYGSLQDSSLTARRLAEAPSILVASPGYLKRHGVPERPAQLAEHRCLTLQLSSVPVLSWRLHADEEAHIVDLASPLCGDGYLARRWAVAGMGIALKSLFDVIDDLETGRLIRVLPDYHAESMAIHAVFPSRRFQRARVRALYAAIAPYFARRAAQCERWLEATVRS